MHKSYKEFLNERGWFVLFDDFKPPYQWEKELRYNLVGIVVSLIMVVPLCIALVYLYVESKFKKHEVPKMLFGTHFIITLKLFAQELQSKFNVTYFTFKDNGHVIPELQLTTIKDIAPTFISQKYPLLLGRYFAFLWALRNFDIFHLYFDGGFLDRTILWRWEVIIYQFFRKKVVMYAYGEDRTDLLRTHNLLHKVGLMGFNKTYFGNDFIKIKRNYWWSKYANYVIGNTDYLIYLPKLDVMTFNMHILPLEAPIKKELNTSIKILHVANHGIRKGSHVIETALKSICNKKAHIEYELIYNVSREKVLKKMESSHIVIEQVSNGFISFTAFEALSKGNIVLSLMDQSLVELYKFLIPDYYDAFFDQPYLRNTNFESLESDILELIEDEKRFYEMLENTYAFAKKRIQDNVEAYTAIIEKLVQEK